MTCCGADHRTNFCPTCGKALRPTVALKTLLAHLATHLKAAERRLQFRQEKYQEKPGEYSPGYVERSIAKHQHGVDKWKAWHDAVAAVIAEQSS